MSIEVQGIRKTFGLSWRWTTSRWISRPAS